MNERQAEIVCGMETPMPGDDKVQMGCDVVDGDGVDRSDGQLWTQGDLYDALDYVQDALDEEAPEDDEADVYVSEIRRLLLKIKRSLLTMQSVSVEPTTVDLEVLGRTFADGFEYMVVRR